MFRILLVLTTAVFVAAGAAMEGDDGANFWLTVLVHADWDDGDMYRTYQGVVSLYVEPYIENNPAFEDYCNWYTSEYPEENIPDIIGTVHGSGELPIEGSGTSGDVSMTYEGTASITVTGGLIMHPEQGQVMDVIFSGTTDEMWTVHTPDGDIPMPYNAPISPMHLLLNYGNDEIEFTEPWDEGSTRYVFSQAMLSDPFTDPSYEGPLYGH